MEGKHNKNKKGNSIFLRALILLINTRHTGNKIFHNIKRCFPSVKLLEHSVLRTFTAQGGMSGLNYINSFNISKSRCGCPTRASFYIFAGSTSQQIN